MKYKVGDRVRIKSLDWYNENKDKKGNVYFKGGEVKPCFSHCMSIYCGQIMTISDAIGQLYDMIEDDGRFCWVDEMIEGLVEEETKPEPKFKVGDSVEVLKTGNTYTISQMKFNGKEFVYTLSNNGSTVSCFSEEEIEFTEEDKYWCDIMSESDPTTYVLPQGYIFKDENGNVINATKIVLEKKKPEYPKTYDECAEVLGECAIMTHGYKRDVLNALQKLIVCRDAYWKIAGEEMGLGKPWEPIFDIDNNHFVITVHHGEIEKFFGYTPHDILVFPTEEMRDAFYENFKKEIEICKELL